MPAGGASAAYGFSYQYLVTVVYILRLLRDDLSLIPRTVLSVEPDSTNTEGETDDIIDFAVEIDHEPAHRVQVKASRIPMERPLQPAEALAVFARLCGGNAPGKAVLLTNRPLSPGLREACPDEVADKYGSTFPWQPDPTRAEVPDGAVAEIVVDTRTIGTLEQELAELIREFRRDRALGQGVTSSRLLGAIVRHRLFDAAAGLQPQTITALELVEMLSMPDPQIAHMAGAFDWGIPVTGVPNLASSVPRLSILDELTTALVPDSRTPQVGVLNGHTGTGKSVIASDYCHINQNSYEFICWIDSRDTGLIDARIRDITNQLTSTVIARETEIAPLFTGALGRHRGPWLLVFDGVARRQDIDKYLPTSGHGSILITSTNSLGWWSSAHIRAVGEFSSTEAIACFANYADIDPSDLPAVAGAVSEIVDRIGRIPLAVSMAGMYFRNAEGQLFELIPGYFASLEALQDEWAIPAGYDRTAFAAIRHAVDNIGKDTNSSHKRNTKGVLYYGSLLAPELIPLNLIIPAAAESVRINLADPPKPEEADKTLTRGIVTLLRTQTIAHRVVSPDDFGRTTLASDTITIHSLVHEVLRTSYLAVLPPGQLQAVGAILMCFLSSWLGTMRTAGEFFAVEQLRVHAEALLNVLEDEEPLASFSPEDARAYAFTKAFLLVELSACFASTARFGRSTALASKATQILLSLPGDDVARTLAMKPLADIVVDFSLRSVPPRVLEAVSAQLSLFLTDVENSADAPAKAVAYELAEQASLMVTRTQAYRDFPPLQRIAEDLSGMATRNPNMETACTTSLERSTN